MLRLYIQYRSFQLFYQVHPLLQSSQPEVTRTVRDGHPDSVFHLSRGPMRGRTIQYCTCSCTWGQVCSKGSGQPMTNEN